MKVCCVIPARFGSTRFPGKPLEKINGIPLIIWTYQRAVEASVFDKVLVATDDKRIFDTVEQYKGYACMTSDLHQSGTDRALEAIQSEDCTHVVNLQGDEPDIPIRVLQSFTKSLSEIGPNTLLTIVSHATISEGTNPNVVKAVLNTRGEALYFSRSLIPFDRDSHSDGVLKHRGIYGFSRESLINFCGFPHGVLEKRECLEQLRALEYGMKIQCILENFDATGIDTPEDLEKFRSKMANMPLEK